MPGQLSTLLYVSDYREKTSGQYFVATATGHARLEQDSDLVQSFNITVFYPLDESKPCYVPKLRQNSVLSVANSKFSRGPNNYIDLIVTAATVMDINPEDLPAHPVNVVATAIVSDCPTVSDSGTRFDCVITDYISKNNVMDIPITCFHPPGSRLANQTITLKRGSSVFVSGALSSIEDQFYLELHNFSFVRGQATSKSTTEMPWSTHSAGSSPSTSPKKSHSSAAQTIHRNAQEKPSTSVEKRKKSQKFSPNKMLRLSDIASEALNNETPEHQETQESEGSTISE